MTGAIPELTRHRQSAAWGDMAPEEFSELVDDIEANGQREPIVLHEGQVLDGWNRYRACRELGQQPKIELLAAGVDPIDFVISLNGRRRNQTSSQACIHRWGRSPRRSKRS
ncbi:MAG TPA: ParB N-terminal domain-containing protein [Aquabacterium sp.]|nr:ParB N-terminal domain-containing protein [Aquabacterium sp.]